jgi:hypothetical protein
VVCLHSNIHDFSIEAWPFHEEEERQKWAMEVMQRQEGSRRAYGREHHGVISSPLFKLPLTQVVPCNLHALMAILKKLVSTLV